LEEQVVTFTGESGMVKQLMRVGIPVLRTQRLAEEIAECIKSHWWLWWKGFRAERWPFRSPSMIEFEEKRWEMFSIRFWGGLAEGGMKIDQSWRGWLELVKLLMPVILIECSEIEQKTRG